jgi:3-hydroxy acid dehydrogenase/malonic semialdehyde reductase
MVETEFSVVRFRGDEAAAKKVYEGLQPCQFPRFECSFNQTLADFDPFFFPVTAEDIAEEIVWAAARPPHVNIADVLVFPVNQASAGINYKAPKK